MLRRFIVAVLCSSGLVLSTAAPVAAGDVILEVTGTATCDPATGQHTIDWTIAVLSSGTPTVVATQTPPGAELTVTPNPIPGNTSATAQGTLPGSTVGQVDLVVAVVNGPTFTGSVTLGGCTQALEVVPVFTG